MDCNKEEAMRSREIAKKKMESKDFIGARKFALKAQQLSPDIENISHMLMVCDVHCASEKRLFGNEMDWYGILQIEQTANEAVIRKQFRKYALLLHPDKNKFNGAEAAFKLVGEAQRVLLDPEKRRLHDIRRKPAVPYQPPPRVTPTFNVGVQTNFRNNFTSFIPQHQPPPQQGQSGFVHNRATFWTVCLFCSVRYQYYKEVVNRSLCCQNCKKPFVAYDMELQGAHPLPMTNLNQTSFFQQQNSFNHRAEVGCQSNSQSKKRRTESSQKAHTSLKRRKQTSESSESCDTGNSSDFDENVVTDEDIRRDVGCSGEHRPRRSSRRRQRVSYNENLSSDDNDCGTTPTKSKRSKSSSCSDEDVDEAYEDDGACKINNQSGSADVADNQRERKQQENNCSEGRLRRSKESENVKHKETADTNGYQRSVESPGDSESNLLSCSDPDFNNFDELRNRECFALGQIWAMYDDVDTMPRFYARINKVFPSGFKVQITWLELATKEEGQRKCVDKKLPLSCGEFVFGSIETMTDCGSMFSHAVSWEKGGQRDSFKIYPRKGEVWALFKNWDKSGICDSSCQYEYEFVETLSEYTEEAGVDVALLAKVKGFSCLFCRMVKEGEKSFQVLAAELFRFSHRVPSFSLTGDEREDVPKGTFELDPAALPSNLPEISIPKHLKRESANMGPNTLKSMMGCNGSAATPEADFKSDSAADIKSDSTADIKSDSDDCAADIKSDSDDCAADIKSDSDDCAADIKSDSDDRAADIKSDSDDTAADIKSKSDGRAADIKSDSDDSTADIKSDSDESAADIKTDSDDTAADIKSDSDDTAADIKSDSDDTAADIKSDSDDTAADIKSDSTVDIKSDSDDCAADIKSDSDDCAADIKSDSDDCAADIKSNSDDTAADIDIKSDSDDSAADIKSDSDDTAADIKRDSACVDEAIEVPDPDFFNFDAEKSCVRFQIGQIWALYSEEDGLPRYYGQIKKVTKEPKFEVKLTWLESSALPSDIIKWHDKGMSISCGKFASKRTKTHCCTSTGSFSHLVRAIPTSTPKFGYSISPTKGEVWALYKNWTPEIRCSDLEKCKYDVVVVIKDDDLQIEVLVLKRVDGFKSVFKPQVKDSSKAKLTFGITRAELLRFSHQIPSIRLTNEGDGSLRGYWELDPAALPVYYFS